MTEQLQNDPGEIPNDTPLPKRPLWQRLLAVAIIFVLLAAGVAIAGYLIKTKPKAKKNPPPKLQALVNTITVAPADATVRIGALGHVIPAREINLQARVSGTVVFLHPEFLPGGIVKAGDVLARLDDLDYRLALQQKRNLKAQAEADLRIEQGNQAVAAQEWDLINREIGKLDATNRDLVLRKPQLDKIEISIAAAATEIEKAEVELGRTVVKASFNAIVRTKNIDLGSQVSSQSTIAVLTGIDTYWVEISLPVANLAWISLPANGLQGPMVTVQGSDGSTFAGRIVNLLPDLDQEGLMARLLIAVDDPMGLKGKRQPLLLGSFIRVEIEGRRLENVIRIPRAALKDGGRVLVATPENTLHVIEVSISWKDNDWVYIDSGLQAGDRVILSNVPAAIEGMALQIIGEDAGSPQPASGNSGDGKQ